MRWLGPLLCVAVAAGLIAYFFKTFGEMVGFALGW